MLVELEPGDGVSSSIKVWTDPPPLLLSLELLLETTQEPLIHEPLDKAQLYSSCEA